MNKNIHSTSMITSLTSKKKKINVLLTGSNGFVGRNSIKPLIESGLYNVYALLRSRSVGVSSAAAAPASKNSGGSGDASGSSKKNVPNIFKEYAANPSFNVLYGDIVDLVSDSQKSVVEHLRRLIFINNIDVIVHLAAAMDFYPDDNSVVFKTNVIATKNLLESTIYNSSLDEYDVEDNDEDQDNNNSSDDNNSNNNSDNENSVNSSSSSSSNSNSNVNNSSNKRINGNVMIKRFIYCSSTEAMGGVYPANGVLRNEYAFECRPNFYYGETKLEAEDAVRQMERRYGLDTIILRITGIYGKDDDFSVFEMIQAISYGLIFFIPSFATGSVMYTHIDDVVSSLLLAIRKKRTALDDTKPDHLPYTYVICPDKGMSYRDVLIFINEKLNRMKPRLVLPGVIVQPVIGFVGKIFYLFKKKKFLYKSDTLIRMSEDRLFSNDRAKKELGFKPQYSFKQGLNVTIEEYMENDRISYYPVSPLFIASIMLILFVKFITTWFK
ncbi:hypothetical protein PPL_03649 [Heterostelium album PN500]|uniref:NAD-dependent epimerase/dehydratase domain-containing protein n=1 Tax=Heterostelium pallidum (strain ATCC 26659 / Pp 5 / PN500) TaxID=670386 RepID=D3B6A1_HETP5|nr:hypothetical protein PPL_03649 [Heterostelium album PN500]EFA82871.1 hypothetical protein PPL_03649 [Heterostelium album PN500]|eukprot:XP_020434988.1 hypothetical protein PPL_03649 [Heterostelium album PN500]